MKKHVLLIDGDKNGLNFFVEALNLTGINYKCTWASDGEQAVSQLQYITPDAILINLDIAGIDAFAILGHAMQQPHLTDSPIVLYGNAVTKEVMFKASSLGAASCINKPADALTLAEILKDVLAAEVMADTAH